MFEVRKIYAEILESNISTGLKEELLQRSIADNAFLGATDDLLTKLKFLTGFGISIDQLTNLDSFYKIVREVCQKIVDLETKFSISKVELSAIVENQPLTTVYQLLIRAYEGYLQKEKLLLEEWEMYSATLHSIGHSVEEQPKGIQELENGVNNLKIECTTALGKSGISILSYLKGDRNFPDDATLDEIKKSLEILRPVFIKFLKEEGDNAGS
jgi:hypothetical protein